MGWVFFVGLAAATGLLLWRTARPHRAGLQLVAAALLAAAAGYTWQGHPGLAGARTRPVNPAAPDAALFARLRPLFGFAAVGGEADVLASADVLFDHGAGDYAVAQLRAGLNASPRSMALWTGLGDALVRQAEGQVTPAARLAFARARAADPKSAAPDYFLALALARAGELTEAEAIWRRLLEKAPKDARWRPLVVADLLLAKAVKQRL